MQYYEDFKVNIPRTSEQGYTVTKEAIIAFACEWDPLPFHLDEEVAKASPSPIRGQQFGVRATIS
jgi:acyl dehydratase